MFEFITAVWASNLFGIIYLIVGVFVGANLLNYIDPSGWAVLLHTDKEERWASYKDKNGCKVSISAGLLDKFLYFFGLLVLIIFWPAVIAIIIVCKLFKYGLFGIVPHCLAKVPTFTIKVEKEKK